MFQAFGAIKITNNQAAQSLNQSEAQVTALSQAGAVAASADGDLSIVPDPTNNRIKLQISAVYTVWFSCSAFAGGAGNFTLVGRINSADRTELTMDFSPGAAGNRASGGWAGVLDLRSTPGNPGSGDPTYAYLDIGGVSDQGGGVNLTIQYGELLVKRVG